MPSRESSDSSHQSEEDCRTIEAHYVSLVDDLVMQGMLSTHPYGAQRAKILEKLEGMDPDTALEELGPIIRKACPNLVTDIWEEQLKEERRAERADRNRWEKENSFGKYAPEIVLTQPPPLRRADDPDATQKQKDYLKLLGFRDKEYIERMGKSQASDLITNILELREKSDLKALKKEAQTLRPYMSSGNKYDLGIAQGIILVIIFVGFIVWLYLQTKF